MNKLICALVLCGFASGSCGAVVPRDVFSNLPSIEQYAQHATEYPLIDNDFWADPDYTSFYISLMPSYREKIKSWFGYNTQRWSPPAFQERLEAVLEQREMNGYTGNFIQKVTPKVEDIFLIWGDLYGAFHSLVRDLVYLRTSGIINDSLKVIDPHYYFVFNGNAISRGAYSLETLSVLMQLMLVNPERVIYLKGAQEDKQTWMYNSFKKELKMRAPGLCKEEVPCSRMLTRFFNTLPLAFFLRGASVRPEQSVIKIGVYDLEKNGFETAIYEPFLAEYGMGGLETFKLNSQAPIGRSKALKVEAVINTEDRTTRYEKTTGLVQLEPDKKLTSWAVFSSPTGSSRRLYNFFYDAFARIEIVDSDINTWTISLINRDSRDNRLNFRTVATYQLVSAISLAKKAPNTMKPKNITDRVAYLEDKIGLLDVKLSNISHHKTEGPVVAENKEQDKGESPDLSAERRSRGKFIVGCTLDLSKGLSAQGNLLKQGLLMRFKQEEQEGNVSSEIRIEDDQYNPVITRRIVEGFIKEDIHTLLGSSGSPTLEGYLDLIKAGKVLSLFPSTGATIFRNASLKHMIHWRASYDFEGEVLMTYALDTLSGKKIAIFYQDDVFGKALLQGASTIISARSATNVVKIPYSRNNVDFSQQEKTVREQDCDTIIFLSTTIAAKELIRLLGSSYCAGRKLLGSSEFGEDVFKSFVKEKGIGFINLNVVPNPKESKMPIVQEFRKYAMAHDIPLDTFVLESYITAALMFDMIKRISGTITQDALIAVCESIKDYNFKGLVLHFNPATRELMNKVWIDTGKPDWEMFEKKIDITAQSVAQKGEAVGEKPVASASPVSVVEAKVPEVTQSQPGNVQEQKITMVSLLGLSKGLSTQSSNIQKGLTMRFAQSREEGKGIIPTLVVENDSYTPSKTRALALESIGQGLDLFIGSAGSATLASCLDLVKEKKMFVLFPVTGAPIFRVPEYSYIVHWAASYALEGSVLMKHALNVMNAKKIACFYQNDDAGIGWLKGVKQVDIAGRDVKIIELPYERNTVNFSEQIKACREKKVDAIIFLSTAVAAQTFIKEMGISSLMNTGLLGSSDCGDLALQQFIKENGLKFVCVNSVPNPKTSQLPIAQEFRDVALKNGYALDAFLMQAYISADIAIHYMNQIKGPVTKESFQAVIAGIKNENHKGLTLNFNPATNELMNQAWLDTGSDEWAVVQ